MMGLWYNWPHTEGTSMSDKLEVKFNLSDIWEKITTARHTSYACCSVWTWYNMKYTLINQWGISLILVSLLFLARLSYNLTKLVSLLSILPKLVIFLFWNHVFNHRGIVSYACCFVYDVYSNSAVGDFSIFVKLTVSGKDAHITFQNW